MLGDPIALAQPSETVPLAVSTDEDGPETADFPSPPWSPAGDGHGRARQIPTSPLGKLVAAGSNSLERQRYRSRSQSSLSGKASSTPSSPPANGMARSPHSPVGPQSPGAGLVDYLELTATDAEESSRTDRRRSKIERTMGEGADAAHMVLSGEPGAMQAHATAKRFSATPTITDSGHSHDDVGTSSQHGLLLGHRDEPTDERPESEIISPEKKTVLNRRTMKLQRVLGEVLTEEQVETHIVEAAKNGHLHRALADDMDQTSKVDQDVAIPQSMLWPSPQGRTPQEPPSAFTDSTRSPTSPSKTVRRLSSSIPVLGRLFKTLTGENPPPDEVKAGQSLHIMVHRTRITDLDPKTNSPTLPSATLRKRNSFPSATRTSPVAAGSPASPEWDSHEEVLVESDEEDELMRTLQRKQLAKLHRLLGTKVPIELLFTVDKPLPPVTDIALLREASLAQASRLATSIPQRTLAQRIRSSIQFNKTERGPDVLPIARGSYFMAPAVFDDPGEKQLAMKKATKLREIFGEHPPLSLTKTAAQPSATVMPDSPRLGRHSMADSSSLSREYGTFATFSTYRRSLASLEYLASAKPDSLLDLVSALQLDLPAGEAVPPVPAVPDKDASSAEPSADSTSPMTPDFNKYSFPVYRRRAGKLKWLLGNAVAAQIGSVDASQWSTNDALLGLVGGLEWAAERDAREGLLEAGDLQVIREQAEQLRKGRQVEPSEGEKAD